MVFLTWLLSTCHASFTLGKNGGQSLKWEIDHCIVCSLNRVDMCALLSQIIYVNVQDGQQRDVIVECIFYATLRFREKK